MTTFNFEVNRIINYGYKVIKSLTGKKTATMIASYIAIVVLLLPLFLFPFPFSLF